MRLPAGSERIVRTLRGAGYECYLVGGSVRDLLLGRPSVDVDFTTNARPLELQRLFPRSHYENRFGTVLVRSGGRYREVTTYRGEGRYSDHRHPDEIRFVDRLEEDLQRRDFTVNAMAMDDSGHVIDPFGGRADLDAQLIRAVGNPAERLAEDPLRMMRAVRLAVQLNFSIEPSTAATIRRDSALLAMISRERIRDELLKILACDRAATGIELLNELGLLPDVLPELAPTRQSIIEAFSPPGKAGALGEDGYRHAIETLRNCRGDPLVRLAALLHVLTEGRSEGQRDGDARSGTASNSLSLAGEGGGEGEPQAPAGTPAAPPLDA